MTFKRKRKMLNIEKMKAEHGGVFEVVYDGTTILLAKPSRKIVSLALAKGKTDALAMSEVLIQNCWLGGDESLKTDVGLAISLMPRVDEILGVKQLEIKNL
jgi:hypothetical protein